MKNSYAWKVFVRCMTYNQAMYIEKTMDGFTMQQTSFPYICCIMDDASSDGEPDVIQRYLDVNFNLTDGSVVCEENNSDYRMVFAQHKQNKNCFFAVFFLKVNLYGSAEKKEKKLSLASRWSDLAEYIAYCEGDDYWIHSAKLQKQVDIMDNRPEIGFVYTGFSTVDDKGDFNDYPWCKERMKRSHSGDVFRTLLDHNMILTLTVCVRNSLIHSFFSLDDSYSKGIDYYMFLFFAGLSDSVYIPEKMGVYRINPNGLVQSSRKLVNELCNSAVVSASSLYLKGIFRKRPYWEDVNIKLMIIRKLLKLTKEGFLSKKDFVSFLSLIFKHTFSILGGNCKN